MSEFSDSFGPMPTDGFKGENPEFKSVKDVYYYMYDELEDAIACIDTDIDPTTDEAQCDPAYSYDPDKWKAYGISMWMRLAMRLSEADPDTYRSHEPYMGYPVGVSYYGQPDDKPRCECGRRAG